MRGAPFLLVGFAVAASCGGKIGDGTDAGGDSGGGEVSTNGQCCPISQNPSCCMSFGGYAEGAPCGQVCDGMPEPNEPGWHQSTDSHGCPIWVPPAQAATYCGQPPPPIDAGACTPADMSMWAPQIDPPFYAHANVCTTQQLQDIYVACFANADAQKCQQLSQQYASCFQCLMTPDTAAKWGALLTLSSGVLELDIAGCLAITSGDASPTSCAQKASDAMQCERTACAGCVVVDQPSAQDYQSCIQAAGATTCNKFTAAECAIDGGPLAACFPSDFKSGFFTFGPLFCGP